MKLCSNVCNRCRSCVRKILFKSEQICGCCCKMLKGSLFWGHTVQHNGDIMSSLPVQKMLHDVPMHYCKTDISVFVLVRRALMHLVAYHTSRHGTVFCCLPQKWTCTRSYGSAGTAQHFITTVQQFSYLLACKCWELQAQNWSSGVWKCGQCCYVCFEISFADKLDGSTDLSYNFVINCFA